MVRVLVKIVWGLAVIVWIGFGMWWGWNNWWKKSDEPKWKLDKTKVVKINQGGDKKENSVLVTKNTNNLPEWSVIYGKSDDGRDWLLACPKKGFKEEFGPVWTTYSNGLRDWVYVTGIFEKWEEIPDSKDRYLILKDPIKDRDYKVRVLYEKSRLSSVVNAVDEVDGSNLTGLYKGSISNICKGSFLKKAKFINWFYRLKNDNINQLIQKGDVLMVYTIPVGDREPEFKKQAVRKDQSDVRAVASVILRRRGL